MTTDEKNEDSGINFLKGTVTRYSFNDMSSNEQKRFFKAVHTMAKNKNGDGTSDFFRIASYHGGPGPIYCQHGRETFPGWHRIYLKHFEDHLRLADKENGNDGNIGLPYWDWTNHEKLAPIIREEWSEYPKGLFPKESAPRSNRIIRASDRRIRQNINRWGVKTEANDCLMATQHWVHASTGNEWASRYPSLESPHNSIHGIVGGNGGPMGSVARAAFDIVFWLHHCNVDRIYEKYLELEEDSAQEFEERHEHEHNNLFDRLFTPFNTIYKKEDYSPDDTFNTVKLGYRYDDLPSTPKQELRLRPTLVIYPQVQVHKFESKCYQVHCFLVDKTKEDEFVAPKSEEDFDNNPNYAGARMIFGRGRECKNCVERQPYDITMDVGKTLNELNISRYNVKIITYVFETNTTDNVYILGSETQLPEPYITGPLFENSESNLQENNEENKEDDEITKLEIINLQKYLKRYGYYDGKLDGDFAGVTLQAVKDFQKVLGLKVDGIVGPITKKSITSNKRCANVDPFAQNDVKDVEVNGDKNYGDKKKLTYTVRHIPGYLKKKKIKAIIEKCFDQWSSQINLKFKYINHKEDKDTEIDIKIEFNAVSKDENNQISRFDGIGGTLGHSGRGYVYFDNAERWVYGYDLENDKIDTSDISDLGKTETWYRGQPKISFYYTCLHEIGHTIGLDHSEDGKDVMGPYYSPELVTLQEGDVNRIKKLYEE